MTIVNVAMEKFLAIGKFAMDLRISIVSHFSSLEHVVQFIHVVELEIISKTTTVAAAVRKKQVKNRKLSNIIELKYTQ